MRNTLLTKAFSIFTSLALVLCSFPAAAIGPAPVSELPGFVRTLTPSPNLGSVVSTFSPDNSALPRLIVIADLHGQMDVQEKIIGMLEGFVNRLTSAQSGASEARVPIYLEGGWTPHLEEPLRVIKDSKERSFIANYMFHKAELPAGQAFSERHPGSTRFTLTGVEDKAIYDANVARFKETYPVRKLILEAIAKHEQPLEALRNKVENRSFGKLCDLRKKYADGKISADDYAKVLLRHAQTFGIGGTYVHELESLGTVSEGETDIALMEVHRLVSARLCASAPFTAHFRKNFEQEDRVRENLAYVDGYVGLLKRVLSDQLSPDEVSYAISVLPHLVRVAEILLGNDQKGIDLRSGIARSLDFYPFAFMRDEILVKNALAALQKDETHATTGILVVGGFHADATAEYLKSQKIPYMLVNPNVERELTASEQLNYIKRICGEHVTPSEFVQDMSKPWVQALATPVAAKALQTSANVAAEQAVAQNLSFAYVAGQGLPGLSNYAHNGDIASVATEQPMTTEPATTQKGLLAGLLSKIFGTGQNLTAKPATETPGSPLFMGGEAANVPLAVQISAGTERAFNFDPTASREDQIKAIEEAIAKKGVLYLKTKEIELKSTTQSADELRLVNLANMMQKANASGWTLDSQDDGLTLASSDKKGLFPLLNQMMNTVVGADNLRALDNLDIQGLPQVQWNYRVPTAEDLNTIRSGGTLDFKTAVYEKPLMVLGVNGNETKRPLMTTDIKTVQLVKAIDLRLKKGESLGNLTNEEIAALHRVIHELFVHAMDKTNPNEKKTIQKGIMATVAVLAAASAEDAVLNPLRSLSADSDITKGLGLIQRVINVVAPDLQGWTMQPAKSAIEYYELSQTREHVLQNKMSLMSLADSVVTTIHMSYDANNAMDTQVTELAEAFAKANPETTVAENEAFIKSQLDTMEGRVLYMAGGLGPNAPFYKIVINRLKNMVFKRKADAAVNGAG